MLKPKVKIFPGVGVAPPISGINYMIHLFVLPLLDEI